MPSRSLAMSFKVDVLPAPAKAQIFNDPPRMKASRALICSSVGSNFGAGGSRRRRGGPERSSSSSSCRASGVGLAGG